MVWLPVFGNFNMHSGVDACNCTLGLYGHRKRVCTGSRLWEKHPLPYWGHSNPCQYGTWLFSFTLCQLCYPCQHHWKVTAGIIFCLWIWFQMHEVPTLLPPPSTKKEKEVCYKHMIYCVTHPTIQGTILFFSHFFKLTCVIYYFITFYFTSSSLSKKSSEWKH